MPQEKRQKKRPLIRRIFGCLTNCLASAVGPSLAGPFYNMFVIYEEESMDQNDPWMLYQLLCFFGRFILLLVHTLVFIEDGHWEPDKNCKEKVKVLKPQVSSPIIRNPIAGRIWMPEQMMKGQARLGTLSEVRTDPS